MILKFLLVVGGLMLIGTMIYDRFTGRRVTRKLAYPLLGALVAVIIAIAVRSFVM